MVVDFIEQKLKQVSQLSDKREYHDALSLCKEVIELYPDDYRGYNQRAKVFARMKDWDSAIDDVSKAIELNPKEPAHFFSRARWYIQTGCSKEALDDLNQLIDLEHQYRDSYYLETAYFLRALANRNLGSFDDAAKDLENVREDFTIYLLGKVQSKKDLLDQEP